MTGSQKSHFFHPAVSLLLGLITAQVIATIQVYLSNLNLYAAVKVITDTGYLAVPNQNIMPKLKEFAPAFYGGIFFSLSIGAGISLASLAAAWTWDRILVRNKHVLVLYLLFWLGLILFLIASGFSLFVTLYILAIPLIVFWATIKILSKRSQPDNNRYFLIHLIPVVVLAILWSTQYDRYLFLDLRDYLLFSNPIGKKVTDFYYTYTLYAAEAFKSLNQKTLKTCRLTNFSEKNLARLIERKLIYFDYLPVDIDESIDLKIIQSSDYLIFEHHGRKILKITANDFLSKTRATLNRFSRQTDRFVNFRKLTFLCVVFGYPLTLYILFHALFWVITRLFVDYRKAAVISSIVCLVISLLILVAFLLSRSPKIEEHELTKDLNSDRWQTRVAALRFIEEKKIEISQLKDYSKIATSLHTPERYWFVKVLANSREPETFGTILELLNDSNINVVSMAYSALAQRKDPRAVKEILERIKISDNWYSQLYAYKALRALGWRQKRLR
jgi:hypothetical protein